MISRLLLTVLSCCIACIGYAQLTFRGTVLDENDNPISNANVRIEKSNIATTSNNAGKFILEGVPQGSYTIRASRIDYEAVRMNVNESSDDLILRMTKTNLNLNEVVITGTGTHHKLKNSPIPIEVINEKDIEFTGAVTFDNVLSMLSSSTNTKGTANISLNGLGNKHILILVDGKKLAGDTSGDNDLSRIDMSNVKRIEIVKGGASALYGSDAMGGVINIITNTPKENINISNTTRISRKGQFYEAVNAGFKHKKFSSLTSYQRDQTDGWQLSKQEITSKGKLVDTDKQAVTGYHSNVLAQKFTYNPTKALSIYTKGGYYEKQTDRAYSAYIYDMLYKDYNMSLGADYQLKKHTDYIRFDTYFDNYEYYKKYFKDTKSFKIGDKDLSKRQRYVNSTLKGVFGIGEFNKINTGLDFTNDYLNNPGNMAKSKTAYTLAAYIQDELTINRWSIVPGVRFIHHETFKNRLTPKLSVMYGLDHFSFRGSYSSGFRTPNLMELYYDYESGSTISQGNLNLKPEKSNYFSLNGEYFNSFISISVTGYINNISDIIVRNRRDDLLNPEEISNGFSSKYLYENISKARTKGLDISLNAYICKNLTFGLNYSYLDARDKTNNKRLDGSAYHTGTASLNWKKEMKKYFFNVNLNGRSQSSGYYAQSSNKYINSKVSAYQLVNIATTHTFTGFKSFIPQFGIGIDNIFNYKDDKPFNSRYSNTTLGRSLFVSLTLKFKK